MSTRSSEERAKGIARFLSHYPPFDQMDRAELERVGRRRR